MSREMAHGIVLARLCVEPTVWGEVVWQEGPRRPVRSRRGIVPVCTRWGFA